MVFYYNLKSLHLPVRLLICKIRIVKAQKIPPLILIPICDYKKNMDGSDGNAQIRQYYSFVTLSLWYWWPLF